MFEKLVDEWVNSDGKIIENYEYTGSYIDILLQFASWLDSRNLTTDAPGRGETPAKSGPLYPWTCKTCGHPNITRPVWNCENCGAEYSAKP